MIRKTIQKNYKEISGCAYQVSKNVKDWYFLIKVRAGEKSSLIESWKQYKLVKCPFWRATWQTFEKFKYIDN